MTTYEISIELETGYTLNVLVAAAGAGAAITEARRILHGVGVKQGREYSADGVTARPVIVQPVTA